MDRETQLLLFALTLLLVALGAMAYPQFVLLWLGGFASRAFVSWVSRNLDSR